MFGSISLRATAAAPGPSSHLMMVPASRLRSQPWMLLKESSAFMPTLKAVTVSVPSVEASAGVEAPGEDSGGTFLRDLRAHLNQNAARMLLLLLRLLLQLLLGVEAPTRQLP